MTTGEFLEGLKARGVAASIEAGGLMFVPELGPEDEAFVRELALDVARELRRPAPEPEGEALATRVELSAAETLALLLAEEAEADERAARELTEESTRRHRAEKARERRDWLATKTLAEVRSMVTEGRLDAEGVRLWHAARGELERRAYLATFGSLVSGALGTRCIFRFKE